MLDVESLPVLAGSPVAGELAYSAVREPSRVATPVTETEWFEFARGCTPCGGHHRALHEGRFSIRGTSPDRLVVAPGSALPSAGPSIPIPSGSRQARADVSTAVTPRASPG